jgi:hypothetical protein
MASWPSMAAWMPDRDDNGGNPRFVVTSLKASEYEAKTLYEQLYCARGEPPRPADRGPFGIGLDRLLRSRENRIKECQLDLFADRTSTKSMQANQLRLWLASMAFVLLTALRRIGLGHTELAVATCGTIRLKLLKIGAVVTKSVRRIRIAPPGPPGPVSSRDRIEGLLAFDGLGLPQRRRVPPRPRPIIPLTAPPAPSPPRPATTPNPHQQRPSANGATARLACSPDGRDQRPESGKLPANRGAGEKSGLLCLSCQE